MSTVRLGSTEDLDRCLEIARGLPDYFTPDVPEKIRSDVGRCGFTVIVDGGTVVGFAVADKRSPQTAEILWAAIDAQRQREGLGTTLVEDALMTLKSEAVLLVEVKTLEESANYEPYEATIAFWEARGFLKIDVIDPLPGWQPGNP
jgi:ribosomal protein S18 acetylase RimI-like enzyme